MIIWILNALFNRKEVRGLVVIRDLLVIVRDGPGNCIRIFK
jgi:hypothetical protein